MSEQAKSQSCAFMVQGFPVTAEQRDAALAVMRGTFSNHEVRLALSRAGVADMRGEDYSTLDRAADRLLQTERKAGRIRVAKGRGRGMWERYVEFSPSPSPLSEGAE